MENKNYKKLDETDIKIFTRIMDRNRKDMWRELLNALVPVLWLVTCSINIVICVKKDDDILFYVWHLLALLWICFLSYYLHNAYGYYKDMRAAKKILGVKTGLQ